MKKGKSKEKKNQRGSAPNKATGTTQTDAQKDGFRYDYDDASDVK